MRSSSSNSKLSAREEESLLARKVILKSGGSAYRQAAGAKFAANGSDAILQKIAALDKFNSKNKSIQKTKTHQAYWMDEQKHLNDEVKRIERLLSQRYDMLLSMSLRLSDEDSSSLMDMMNAYHATTEARDTHQQTLLLQIHELKCLMKNHITKPNQNAAQEKQAQAVSVFAQLLMKIRNDQLSLGEHLSEEEKRLTAESHQHYVAAMRMVANDKYEAFQARVNAELQPLESDSAEVLNVLDEWRHKLMELDHSHREECQRYHEEKLAACHQCGVQSAEDVLGGWRSEDHTMFVKIYKRVTATGAAHKKLSELLRSSLPHITAAQISEHENWYRATRAIDDRRHLATSAYETKRAKMLHEATNAIELVRKKAKDDAIVAAQREEHERRRHEMHQTLERQRIERMTDMENKLAELKILQAEAEAEEMRQKQRRDAEVHQKKVLAEHFKRQKEAAAEQRRLQEEEAAKREAAQRHEANLAAAENIKHREELRRQKELDRKRREEKALEEEARRLEIIMRLAEQVPYFDMLQNVTSKLDHVTASALAQQYVREEDAGRGHYPLNGFTDQKVFSDARFRLGLALRAAGVHQSEAARVAVQNMHPRSVAPW